MQGTAASDKSFDKKDDKALGKTLNYLLSRKRGKKFCPHERSAPAKFHGAKRKVGDASGHSAEEAQKYNEKYYEFEENKLKRNKLNADYYKKNKSSILNKKKQKR